MAPYTYRETEARAFTLFLGCKEGFEYPIQIFFDHPHARIGDRNEGVRAGFALHDSSSQCFIRLYYYLGN